MIKNYPRRNPAAKSATGKAPAGKRTAAPAGDAALGIFTAPFATARAGDRPDQRESPTRRAHRLRMKEIFTRAKPAS